MAKRKAAVNDMIFELDNDDIVISSDEEDKVTKLGRFDGENSKKIKGNQINKEVEVSDVINLDICNESEHNITSTINKKNGGKNTSQVTSKQNKSYVNTEMKMNDEVIDITDEKKKSCQNTIIFNEDIVIDSPASNTDLGVVGCENRAPLVSIRFNDSFIANSYKKIIKEFIVDLLKSKSVINADSETDNELEIWPEDLVEEEFDKVKETSVEDNLFFVDTTPGHDVNSDIPLYRATKITSNEPEKDTTPQTLRRGHTCFNCGESHLLKDCPKPRNNAKIHERRKAFTPKGRYHVENEQKYGHLIPGRISAQLRHALGLKRNELPLHIYRMRLLGYPPGWLEEARISHSGITLFDSTGRATLGPNDEEGEVFEPGSRDKFDIKKILDFPGFNVSASSRYIEEAHLFGLPGISDQDSKIAMLKILAPNAVEAYKRKKLSFFPSAQKNSTEEGQAEMELDSGDEEADFPSMPPLPDDEPPTPPPPPPPLPLTETNINKQEEHSNKHMESLKQKDDLCSENRLINIKNVSDKARSTPDTICDGSSDLEVIEVVRVNDIPIPEDDLIVIDDDDDKSSLSSGRNSPSLDDLEKRKQKLLEALKGDTISVLSEISIENNDSNEKGSERDEEIKSVVANKEKLAECNENSRDLEETDKESINESAKSNTTVSNASSTNIQSNLKTGQIKNTEYGTLVINAASPYQKLPSDVNFAKDICDVLYFENLPNSVGKYQKICSLLKKVKSQVDRIQDS